MFDRAGAVSALRRAHAPDATLAMLRREAFPGQTGYGWGIIPRSALYGCQAPCGVTSARAAFHVISLFNQQTTALPTHVDGASAEAFVTGNDLLVDVGTLAADGSQKGHRAEKMLRREQMPQLRKPVIVTGSGGFGYLPVLNHEPGCLILPPPPR